MRTGFPQQQPFRTSAGVRSAPTQQHGAQMWRASGCEAARTVNIPDEEKSFAVPLKH